MLAVCVCVFVVEVINEENRQLNDCPTETASYQLVQKSNHGQQYKMMGGMTRRR